MPEFPATRCTECGELYGHPVFACRACGNEQLVTNQLDGTGVVYARTTIRVPGMDHLGEEPFEICLVDVGKDETVRVTARLTGTPHLSPGDRVEFLERDQDDVFWFQPELS